MFDPFGDFETNGYLRNLLKTKDIHLAKNLEHQLFVKNISGVIDWLTLQDNLNYEVLLETHKKIFQELYPWAGQDRFQLTPHKSVMKGEIIFAPPEEIHTIFTQAINQKTLGKVLGGLALAHPFLDGNGRALVTFFSEICRREKKLIRWDLIEKNDYLVKLGDAIEGKSDNLDKLLAKNIVAFPFERPDKDRVLRLLSSINWGEGVSASYKPLPTLIQKIFKKQY